MKAYLVHTVRETVEFLVLLRFYLDVGIGDSFTWDSVNAPNLRDE